MFGGRRYRHSGTVPRHVRYVNWHWHWCQIIIIIIIIIHAKIKVTLSHAAVALYKQQCHISRVCSHSHSNSNNWRNHVRSSLKYAWNSSDDRWPTSALSLLLCPRRHQYRHCSGESVLDPYLIFHLFIFYPALKMLTEKKVVLWFMSDQVYWKWAKNARWKEKDLCVIT